MNHHLYVDKSSGTFADQLTAFGLAVVVRDILRRAYDERNITVTLIDRGSYYELNLSRALDDTALRNLQGSYMPYAPVIVTPKNRDSLQDAPLQSIDYEEERNRRGQFYALHNSRSPEQSRSGRAKTSPELVERFQALEPNQQWDVFRAINPAALAGYNKLVLQWQKIQPALREVMALVRDLYANTPNDVAAAESAWRALDKAHDWGIPPQVTCLQIYNPNQGKGQNSAKPDRLSMDNLKAFWLPEFFKAVGYYAAALTKQPRSTKDRKTFVLAPMELDLAEHERVFGRFRQAMEISETPVRLDILATLRYLQVLLDYAVSDDGQVMQNRLVKLKRPSQVVAGFSGAYYKSLGNSQATMNVPFLGLPEWVQSTTRGQMDDMLHAVEEHIAIVRQFDESHSEDKNLLLAYRDFCSGNSLDAFFAFAVDYAGYIIGRRERRQRVRQFSEENLRRLIMGTDPTLQPILDTPGFQNIAYAIRQSTVVAQLRKQQGDRRYDVRYGLGQELARKANYATDFIAAISSFIHEYNAENAQVMENRPGPYRRSIRTTDIDDLVRLVDTYGSRTVANLLVAYGYARKSTADAEPQAEDEAPLVSDDDDNAIDESESEE